MQPAGYHEELSAPIMIADHHLDLHPIPNPLVHSGHHLPGPSTYRDNDFYDPPLPNVYDPLPLPNVYDPLPPPNVHDPPPSNVYGPPLPNNLYNPPNDHMFVLPQGMNYRQVPQMDNDFGYMGPDLHPPIPATQGITYHSEFLQITISVYWVQICPPCQY